MTQLQKSRLMNRPIGLAILAALSVCGVALAQMGPGDTNLGRKFALEVCAECHAVEKGDRDIVLSTAPAFQTVADDPAITQISLRVFFQTPHVHMPDLMLTGAETDDVISYILSLK